MGEAPVSGASGKASLPRHAPNELVVVTHEDARNDAIPSQFNVSAGLTEGARSFERGGLDDVLRKLDLPPCTFTRNFSPKNATVGNFGAMAFSETRIGSDYDRDEDNLDLSRTYRLRFEAPIDVEQACGALMETAPGVKNVAPNYYRYHRVQPNDPDYGRQWGFAATKADAGWNMETGHDDVVVAIVDSGVDLKHPDLAAKLITGRDFVDYNGGPDGDWHPIGEYIGRDRDPADEDGHGTHCAGIAAAATDNGIGVAGVCWGGKILPVRVMFRIENQVTGEITSVGLDTDIRAGIKYAVDQGADVINLSLGGYGSNQYGPILQYAQVNGATVVAATGNDDTTQPSYPASDPGVLAVGATNAAGNRASFSNYGAQYNNFVMAPGEDIYNTYLNGGYASLSGTSMATPFVAGLAALIISRARRKGIQITPVDVYRAIRQGCVMPQGQNTTEFGDGLVDVVNSLNLV